ncbi:glycerol-3-phosphate 1-O-acyltransferase PlsY [Paucidesulfovibrio longus]|uniref:glycerol-3-phosphate 1-O-acyltransferase PlsY n=1 Tax=Paucidesulfovibrio longus TaxID=889 RepID=UPI0003B6089A|nr:glycerol-3-phosphate 1-O-acyltransferase PlsY [Paucidesulfovibrio longus]
MHWIFWPLFSYLLGAVPFGLLLAKFLRGVDIRTEGSRNTGATNVARTCGLPLGLTALALDIAKGLVPVLLAARMSDNWLFLSLSALAPILGHVYSPFLGFKGGKAVATTIGAFLGLAFLPTLISVLLCVAAIFASGYVSLGSLVFGAALPAAMLLSGNGRFALVALAVTLLLYWRHRENIARLMRGEENSWRKKKG